MDIITLLPVHVPPAGMECINTEGEKNNICVQYIFSPSINSVVVKYLNRMMSKTLVSLFNKCFSESGLTE